MPRNKRKHLVVSEDVHCVVLLNARARGTTEVQATYELLRIGMAHAVGLHINDSDLEEYVIREPMADKLKGWFHRAK